MKAGPRQGSRCSSRRMCFRDQASFGEQNGAKSSSARGLAHSWSKMKMGQPHVLPLSTRAIGMLTALNELKNHGPLLFPALHTKQRQICENTPNAARRRLGYGGDEMTSHGFRTIASTLRNESGLGHPDAIERALADRGRDQVRAAYHPGSHRAECVPMAQWWLDYLERLRDGASGFRPSFGVHSAGAVSRTE